MNLSALQCGFYEADITPPLGCIIPGAFCARYAKSVQDPLFARTVVIRGQELSLAIASLDACGITLDITQRIRQRVCRTIPMAPENIMVMATHAHGAGPTLNWGEEVVRNEAYVQTLVEKTADAIVSAWQSAGEAALTVGRGILEDVSFIRVYRMKDGSLKTNPGRGNPNVEAPATTIDPEVLVLAAQQDGKYTGAVINYANHPAIVADDRISGDYISVLSKRLKEQYGPQFVTVFINGACGNINHIDVFSDGNKAPHPEKIVGDRLAETVIRTVSQGVPMSDAALCCRLEHIQVKFRKPDVPDLLRSKQILEDMGDDLIECTPSSERFPGDVYMDVFFALQAFRAQLDKRTRQTLELQMFRIGQCYIFGTPCQIFVQFGKRMKAACPGYGFVSAFANDYCGYVPTPDCFVPGVYEARLTTTSALEPAAGDILTDAMIDLCRQCQ